jgi:hypothetical protein
MGPDGEILWQTEPWISRNTRAKIVAGEPGYFYLGFSWSDGIYGQRMDMAGNIYWPTGSAVGARMSRDPPTEYEDDWGHNFAYRYPYFYGVYIYRHENVYPIDMYVNSLDSTGNRRFDENGTLMTVIERTDDYWFPQIIPDDNGGAVALWQTSFHDDVWAKHVNSEGELGGPLGIVRSVEQKVTGPLLDARGQMIQFTLTQAGEIKLELFDLLGRRVAVLEEGFRNPGSYTTPFNRNDLANGMYFIRLSIPQSSEVVKTVVVR